MLFEVKTVEAKEAAVCPACTERIEMGTLAYSLRGGLYCSHLCVSDALRESSRALCARAMLEHHAFRRLEQAMSSCSG